jgi:hypothetical protein
MKANPRIGMPMPSQQESDKRFAVPLGVSTIFMLQYYVSFKNQLLPILTGSRTFCNLIYRTFIYR